MVMENNSCEQLLSESDTHSLLGLSYREMIKAVTSPEVEEILLQSHSKSFCYVDPTAIEIRFITDAGKIWLRYKLRGRVHDGTNIFQESTLTNYDYSGQINYVGNLMGKVIEESTYWTDPRYEVKEVTEDSEISRFILNPFEMLFSRSSEEWISNFAKIMNYAEPPRPGSLGLFRINGLRKYVYEKSREMLRGKGYSYITAVPTWYHVVMMYEHLGFHYAFTSDKTNLNVLNRHLKSRGFDVRNPKSSWVVMLQFWADKLIKEGIDPRKHYNEDLLFFSNMNQIITYKLSPKRNVWMISNI